MKGLMRYFAENPREIGQLDMILGYKNRDCVLYKEEMATWRGKHNPRSRWMKARLMTVTRLAG